MDPAREAALRSGSLRLVMEFIGRLAAIVVEYGQDRGALVDFRFVEVGVLLGGGGGLLIAVFVDEEILGIGIVIRLLRGRVGVRRSGRSSARDTRPARP